jgi:hypothetical protein
MNQNEVLFDESEMKVIDKILKLGGSIKVPFKNELLEWYSEHGVSLHYDKAKKKPYWVFCEDFHGLANYFDTFEEAFRAFEFYLHPKNNVGLAQYFIMQDNPEILAEGELDDPPITKKFREWLKDKKYNY